MNFIIELVYKLLTVWRTVNKHQLSRCIRQKHLNQHTTHNTHNTKSWVRKISITAQLVGTQLCSAMSVWAWATANDVTEMKWDHTVSARHRIMVRCDTLTCENLTKNKSRLDTYTTNLALCYGICFQILLRRSADRAGFRSGMQPLTSSTMLAPDPFGCNKFNCDDESVSSSRSFIKMRVAESDGWSLTHVLWLEQAFNNMFSDNIEHDWSFNIMW